MDHTVLLANYSLPASTS